MKRMYTGLLALLFIATQVSAQEKALPHAQRDHIKGKVKQVKEMYLTEAGVQRYGQQTTYDTHGNEIEKQSYKTGPEPVGKKRSWQYMYSAGGVPTQKKSYSNDSLTLTCALNAAGRCTEHQDNGSYRQEHTYDAQGNETKLTMYDPATGKQVSREVNTYDAQNRKVTETSYDAKGKPEAYITYTYGDKQMDMTVNDGKKKFRSRKVFVYDDQGNTITETKYSAKGKVESECRWKFEYDTQGNWTRKSPGGGVETKEIITREISYY